MTVSITLSSAPRQDADTIVALILKENELTAEARALDAHLEGAIGAYLQRQTKFTGKKGQTALLATPRFAGAHQIVLAGLGEVHEVDAIAAESVGAKIYAALVAADAKIATLSFSNTDHEKLAPGEMEAALAAGVRQAAYRFDKYRTSDCEEDPKPALRSFEVALEDVSAGQNALALYEALYAGVDLARDLINEPPNRLYPESFALYIKKELKPLGVLVDILDEGKMEKLGFGAHLAVGQGSAFRPRVVVMRWNGASGNGRRKNPQAKGPVAFVGKGITFDTGGVNIKPSPGLEAMKIDMGGAAAVVGLLKTLALRKAQVDVVGIVGLAENMASASAYRPSDIVTSLSGKTIEVLNTDAEGRLVLADSMTYVQRTYKPRAMIDLATLTGAMLVALGHEYCGTFVNNDELWLRMEKASRVSGEKLWRMPLDTNYAKQMKGTITDLRNLGTDRNAGASTAAGFLEFFVENNIPWAHMDIAGMTMAPGKGPRVCFGVRVLNQLIADCYED